VCNSFARTREEIRVFENRVLSKIFGPNGDEVTEEWKRLHNEELNNMYYSPKITRLIKEMCGTWHVWGKEEVPTEVWWEA
jgi:hypothetical protein